MTTEDLACLVAEMRDAQRRYFRSRSHSALEASKGLEARVDAACREVLNGPQPSLFPDPEATHAPP